MKASPGPSTAPREWTENGLVYSLADTRARNDNDEGGQTVADKATHATVVGAIRLALEATDDDRAAVAVTRALLEHAPRTPEHATAPTGLLVDVVRKHGRFEVTPA